MSFTKKHNPFRPNSPAPTDMFVGRTHELNRIDDALTKLLEDNPSHIMIVGERGIGKSSLLLFCNALARGQVTWQGDSAFNFLPIQVSVDKNLSKLGMVKKIKVVLERQLRKEEKLFAALEKSWNFLRRIEIAGTKVNPSLSGDDDSVFDDFVYALADTSSSITTTSLLNQHGVRAQKDGIIILIDEADNASSSLDLGGFLKSLAESLQVEGCSRVLFILSGLPRLRDVLRESHPSSLRLFEELELLALSKEDIKGIYNRGLEHVNRKSKQPFSIAPKALTRMVSASEGYPHFVQQIGHSTFDSNSDHVISLDTVVSAIFGENGAIDLIGDRYYRDMYYTNIREDSYREILNIMAEKPGDVTTRKELREKFKNRERTLDNGIKALKARNIILPVEGKTGQYRLQWIGFGLWIRFFTKGNGNFSLAK